MKQATFLHITEAPARAIAITEPGKYVAFFHNLSGTVAFDIGGHGVDIEILGLYTGSDRQAYDLKTVQRHTAAGSRSNLLVKGVFADTSAFTYQGLIRIEQDARKTHAYQKNENILMSKGAFVSSKPELEILCADVFCTHGSTTGMFNPEDLHYLNTRGINDGQAKQLLTAGFIRDIFRLLRDAGCVREAQELEQSVIKTYA